MRKELNFIVKQDQYERTLIKSAPKSAPKSAEDSLWKLQSRHDSIHKLAFENMIAIYGYPSLKRVSTELSAILTLYFTTGKDLKHVEESFCNQRIKGNMPPFEYARRHARCLINSSLPNEFGAYGKNDFTQMN